jgi:hypothetical protein
MKMKAIFLFILLICPFLIAQDYYITAGDSIADRSGADAHKYYYTFLTILDSSDSVVDTFVVQTRTSGTDYTNPQTLGVFDLSAESSEPITTLIPGDGNKVSYLINRPYVGAIRVVRTNITSRTQRSLIWWEGNR